MKLKHSTSVFCYHQNKRPYIILKWAQSRDGFLCSTTAQRKKQAPIFLSTKEEQIKVHQWRTEEQSIAVGAQTVFDDNPSLTARWVVGNILFVWSLIPINV